MSLSGIPSEKVVGWDIARLHPHDASGVTHPEQLLWTRHDNGVYYPYFASSLN